MGISVNKSFNISRICLYCFNGNQEGQSQSEQEKERTQEQEFQTNIATIVSTQEKHLNTQVKTFEEEIKEQILLVEERNQKATNFGNLNNKKGKIKKKDQDINCLQKGSVAFDKKLLFNQKQLDCYTSNQHNQVRLKKVIFEVQKIDDEQNKQGIYIKQTKGVTSSVKKNDFIKESQESQIKQQEQNNKHPFENCHSLNSLETKEIEGCLNLQCKKILRIVDYYKIERLISQNLNQKIYQAYEIKTEEKRIIKQINNQKGNAQEILIQCKTVSLLLTQNHRNIVQLYEIYKNEKFVYLVFPYYKNLSMLKRVQQKKLFEEDELKKIMKDILEGVQYLHSLRIVHRNLNLQNIVVQKQNQEVVIKLTDFSCSTFINENQTLTEIVGDINITAPEVQKQEYNEKCDI